MKKEDSKSSAVQTVPQQDSCAHNWIKTDILGRKALLCTCCGRIIDSQD